MDAKEYLNQAYRIDQRINNKIEILRSMNELATKVTSTLAMDPVSETRNVHKMSDNVEKMIDLKREINKDVDRLVDLKREIMRVIAKIQDARCLMLLELRYLCFKSWEDIAYEMEFTPRWLHKLHTKSLTEVEKILNQEASLHGIQGSD